MDITGEFRIPASRQRVWNALNDPDALRASIPGCQSIEKLSDTQFAAKMLSKVGPVKAKFNTKLTLSKLNPPESYTLTGEGQGGVAGFAKGGADVTLSEDGTQTVLHYSARVQVGGKLAQVGSRLLDGTARKLADEFFTNLVAHLGGKTPPPPAAPAALPTTSTTPSLRHRLWLWATALIVLIALLAWAIGAW
ncbi:MAG: carbon monoxide dehydrogenase subunit G [Acidiferrobacterales bacterium]